MGCSDSKSADAQGQNTETFVSLKNGIKEVSAGAPHLDKSRADALVRSSDKNEDGLYSRKEINDLLKQLEDTRTKLQTKMQERAIEGDEKYITSGQATRALMPIDSFNVQYTRVIKGLMEKFEEKGKCSIEKVADFFSYMSIMRNTWIEQFKDFPPESSFDKVKEKLMEVTGLSRWDATVVLYVADDNVDGHINKQEYIDMWTEFFTT